MTKVRTKISLKIGANSRIPAQIASFNHLMSDKEHIAIIFGKADECSTSPLVRIHSECLTGDVFHSSRCDCGEQLNEAIELMEKEGGIIIYLRQEGRGIGLYNKIDAYKLQSEGMDTYQANNQLGFDNDLRDFTEAGQMLEALNIKKLQLLTNNPLKVKALRNYGMTVEQVISTSTFLKSDNESYLRAKAKNAGHNIRFPF
ncbi:GTP cyclohydrolase II [Psychromonas sp. MB-3u-54]|uniref:GTP cyclohydrolase II n=1 Tax=Psychromonas sp. MB-3u-54 TaxID=2058319 RepID=UPI000C32F122|nr:GTP cyclohydrolase II [Psychromonas sp. MB-3u-54]PKH03325.1 GTP cyclohydrolase II [Psychromonas sp. MB-3u-54]